MPPPLPPCPPPPATWPLIKYKSSYETLTWKFERILLSLKVAMRPDSLYCICLFFLTPDIILLVKRRVLPLSGVNICLLILMTFVDIYKHGIKNESVVEMIKYLLLYKKTNSTIKTSFNLCGSVEFGGPDPQHPPLIPVAMLLLKKGHSDRIAKASALDKFQQFVNQINSLHL
jgi:hypothetical protein